jgi:hypothetical protein
VIALRPEVRADVAAKCLEEMALEAQNVRTGNRADAHQILDAYRGWANLATVQVGQHVTDEELTRAVTTPRYWALQNIDRSNYAPQPFQQFVDLELRERVSFLTREAELLRREFTRWNFPIDGIESQPEMTNLTALVVDTNVILSHFGELGSLNWRSRLNLPRDAPVGLAIPNRVVRELDRLKMSSSNNVNQGTRNELRSDARQALRRIEEAIGDPDSAAPLGKDVYLLLVADRIPGEPLFDSDAEIVDRAASLIPFTKDVYLVSYDAGIIFRARQAGLKAIKWAYEGD